jgi:hypothetical protein
MRFKTNAGRDARCASSIGVSTCGRFPSQVHSQRLLSGDSRPLSRTSILQSHLQPGSDDFQTRISPRVGFNSHKRPRVCRKRERLPSSGSIESAPALWSTSHPYSCRAGSLPIQH